MQINSDYNILSKLDALPKDKGYNIIRKEALVKAVTVNIFHFLTRKGKDQTVSEVITELKAEILIEKDYFEYLVENGLDEEDIADGQVDEKEYNQTIVDNLNYTLQNWDLISDIALIKLKETGYDFKKNTRDIAEAEINYKPLNDDSTSINQTTTTIADLNYELSSPFVRTWLNSIGSGAKSPIGGLDSYGGKKLFEELFDIFKDEDVDEELFLKILNEKGESKFHFVDFAKKFILLEPRYKLQLIRALNGNVVFDDEKKGINFEQNIHKIEIDINQHIENDVTKNVFKDSESDILTQLENIPNNNGINIVKIEAIVKALSLQIFHQIVKKNEGETVQETLDRLKKGLTQHKAIYDWIINKGITPKYEALGFTDNQSENHALSGNLNYVLGNFDVLSDIALRSLKDTGYDIKKDTRNIAEAEINYKPLNDNSTSINQTTTTIADLNYELSSPFVRTWLNSIGSGAKSPIGGTESYGGKKLFEELYHIFKDKVFEEELFLKLLNEQGESKFHIVDFAKKYILLEPRYKLQIIKALNTSNINPLDINSNSVIKDIVKDESSNFVYITKSNAKKILKDFDFDNVVVFESEVYKRKIYFLNELEKKKLIVMKQLMKNTLDVKLKIYQPIERVDTFKYIYESTSKPSFHHDKDCEYLNSTYTNFEIPIEITQRVIDKGGTKEDIEMEVKKFRQWFNQHIELFKNDLNNFLKKLDARWNVQRSLNEIIIENSGIEIFENINLNELEAEIDNVIKSAGDYFNSNKNKQDIIRRYQKCTFVGYKSEPIENNDTGLSDIELKEFIINYDKSFKRPLKELLLQYYRVKYNPELKFHKDLLTQLNFKECNICGLSHFK